jgi:hypothetical protein
MSLTGNPINQNLICFWPMTDGSGGITDISGNGYDGVATSSPTWETTSKGTAPSFTGGSRFEVSSALWATYFNTQTQLSMAGWYYADALTDQSIGLNCFDGVGSEFLVRFDTSRLQGIIGNGGFVQSSTAVTAATAGQWQQYAVTVDMSIGEMKVYMDKVLLTTASFSARTFAGLTDDPAIGASTTGSRAFTGEQQNIRLFDRILSQSDVETLYDDPWAGTSYSPNESTSNVNLLDPAVVKAGLSDGTNLKAGITTSSYGGGTPSSPEEIKNGWLDSEGNLKAGLVDENGDLKKGLTGN